MQTPLPPPPPQSSSSSCILPSPLNKQTRMSPFRAMVLSKQSRNHLDKLTPKTPLYMIRDKPILTQPQKTKPIVWFAAILCMIFTLLIIFFGVAILIVFLAVQPKTPVFDTPGASLTAIYFNSPQYIGNDMTFLANFSNPNRKLRVRFQSLYFELFFAERLIAAQAIQPFSQGPGEVRLVPVHLLPTLVYAPPNLAMELQKQGQRNRVEYRMKGTFKVRVSLGSLHYSYRLLGDCQMEMTSPPNGVLIAHTCKTTK
ncbi:uncharacterized protein LOC127247336 [Andrographis paniculata]|uniref:uncharacterized protein LOC127247336 n=1 Tax=Andrographis paniculata TaxID=175694 RepID=UPI0021E74B7C|nr:uncharacterized protein LOC127247336 [Andrographis paniculata]